MKILFFDTETSGLQAGYNVILQLSYQIVDSNDWSVLKSVNHYFPWPEDTFRISERAIEINGLTQQFLSSQHLSDKASALQEFIDDKSNCELSVAHNLDFDKKFIIEECQELGVKYATSGWHETYDTMKKTTNLCCIPKSWGSGYKYPKLIELADYLHVNANDLNLHNSSSDVELTKRCFRELVERGHYAFSEKVDTSISMKISVEDENDYTITYFDDMGNTYSEEELVLIYGKKNIVNNKKRLIEEYCISANEENNETRYSLKATPEIEDASSLQQQLDNLKPSFYTPATFCEQEPTREIIEKELIKEAKKIYHSILFWTNVKKRDAYVAERIEPQYNRCLQEYQNKKASFEKEEAEKKVAFDSKAMDEYNLRKRTLLGLLSGDVTIINNALQQTPEYTLPLLSVVPSATATSSSEASVEIKLPRISELPKTYGARLASGNYKIKNYSDKELHAFFADYVIGMAFYMAASYLNMAPTLNTIHVTGIGTNDVSLKSEQLYTVTLTREDLSSMNREANAIEAIETFPHKMLLSKSFIFRPL